MYPVSFFAAKSTDTSLPCKRLAFLGVKDTSNPFSVYGLYDYASQAQFMRMPIDLAAAISGSADIASHSVYSHNLEPSGGRVRFATDSPYIAIQAFLPNRTTWGGAMPISGKMGFDVYIDMDEGSAYYVTLGPPAELTDSGWGYEAAAEFPGSGIRNITIYFPVLNPVSDLYIGLANTSKVGKNAYSYVDRAPIAYYGSSITQGGSVSKPGNTYGAILSRRFNYDFINLGMWGSAKGETAFAQYIASRNMSAFVLDYDHNATVSGLRATHENFYGIIRSAHPDIPIIMMSRPDIAAGLEEVSIRRGIIRRTYDNARDAGDGNVYFIDGQTFFEGCPNKGDCLIDGVHPTDLGASLMAEKIENVLEEILKSTKKAY